MSPLAAAARPAAAGPAAPASAAPAPPVPPGRALPPERLDELARALLAGAAPLRVAAAADRRGIEAALALRYAHVVAAGWAVADAYPDGLERDAHDAAARQILAWAGDRVVGTCRVVPRAPGGLLPVEAAFDLRLPPGEALVEWGRLVVAPDCRGDRGFAVPAGLLARAWLETRALGAHVVVGSASAAVLRWYRRLGFAVEVLGPEREHWSAPRVPVRLVTRPAPGGTDRGGPAAGGRPG
jgi:N-acyl-L-homoserine lactone synthetase